MSAALVSAPEAPPFVHLHQKSQFTMLGALGSPKGIVKKAAKMGLSHAALTDEMNLFGAVEFFKAAKGAGIKPVIGAELIVAPGSRLEKNKARDNRRLVALIENHDGYVSLNRLLKESYLTGRHFQPRVDMDLLREHHEGLIFLSGDLRGEVARLLASDRYDDARRWAEDFRDLVGPDDFFLELMDLGWGSAGGMGSEADQVRINAQLRRLSEETGIPTVVTNNVHYIEQDDAFLHDVLLCMGMTNTLEDEFRFRFPSDQFFMKEPADMAALFPDDRDALARTAQIAQRCDFEFEFGTYRFPIYPGLKGRTPEEVLDELSREGLDSRLEVIRGKHEAAVAAGAEGRAWEEREREYRERLDVELQIIKQMKFAAYFLIVFDFINWAREQDIPVGPGRGSGAGSLVLYSLRITDIDPLPYALLFERFLNPERISMPDVDVDFCQEQRGDVIRYVNGAYGGSDKVTQIITFGKMLAKGVIKDVGRVMGLSFSETDKVTKLIPDALGITLPEALEQEPRLPKLMQEDPRIARLMGISKGLEGTTRHCSVHAAGVVIADDDLTKYCPLYKGSGEDDPVVTQYDMKWSEEIGLIKFDFLGLKTLDQVKFALDLARGDGRTVYGEPIPGFFAFNDVRLDDPDVYRLLARGDTLGVFQLESSGMRELLRALKPTVFEDIIAVAALYRPGPMGLGMHHTFVECKHGRQPVTYPHPMLRPILQDTYGVIVFQEQVMQIAQVMGGYTLGQADILRRAMGKKKLDLMTEHRLIFTRGAVERGVDEKTAGGVFDLMAEFANYGFNKSHTAAYGLIAYQTAWVKHHLPAYFYAALMTIESSNSDKVLLYVDDARKHGIEILPPDVNESQLKFSVIDGEKVRFGLTSVKGLGQGAIEAILEARAEVTRFATMDDFIGKIDTGRVNKRVVEALIKCGAFDSMGYTRAALHASLDRIVEYGASRARDRDSGQVGLFGGFGGGGGGSAGALRIPEKPEWPERHKLALEKEALGFYITGHPMSSFSAEIERFTTHTTAGLAEHRRELRGGQEILLAGIAASMKVVTTKAKGERMAFVQLEDMVGSVELTVFPKTFARAEVHLATDQPLLVTAKLDEVTEEGVKLLADEVHLLADIREQQTREVHFELDAAEAAQQALLERLKGLIERFPGDATAKLGVKTEAGAKLLIGLGEGVAVRPSQDFVEAAQQALGRQAVGFR